jgi:hypothetical protein
LAGFHERAEGLIRLPRPVVGAGGLDVEVGAALGRQCACGVPLGDDLERAASAAQLDGHGEFVNADAAGTERGSVVDAIRQVTGGSAGFCQAVSCLARRSGVSREDGGAIWIAPCNATLGMSFLGGMTRAEPSRSLSPALAPVRVKNNSART